MGTLWTLSASKESKITSLSCLAQNDSKPINIFMLKKCEPLCLAFEPYQGSQLGLKTIRPLYLVREANYA